MGSDLLDFSSRSASASNLSGRGTNCQARNSNPKSAHLRPQTPLTLELEDKQCHTGSRLSSGTERRDHRRGAARILGNYSIRRKLLHQSEVSEDLQAQAQLDTGPLPVQVSIRLARPTTSRRDLRALHRMDVLAAKPAFRCAGRRSVRADLRHVKTSLDQPLPERQRS